MEKTKRCKFCQTEIPAKASVCPNCKRTLNSGGGCIVAFLVFFCLVIGGFYIAINLSDFMDEQIQQNVSGVSNESEYITMQEYNQIQSGMTYEEVKEIIGSNGELTSRVDTNGIVVEMYTWYGNGTAGSNANVTFQNDSVVGKAQFGLK